MGKRRQRPGKANHNRKVSWIWRYAEAKFKPTQEDNPSTVVVVSPVFRSRFKVTEIRKVHQHHVAVLSRTNGHKSFNSRQGGIHLGLKVNHWTYDPSKEHPDQCIYDTRADSIHDGRRKKKESEPKPKQPKKVKTKRKAKANRAARAMAKRSSLQVITPRKRGAIFG